MSADPHPPAKTTTPPPPASAGVEDAPPAFDPTTGDAAYAAALAKFDQEVDARVTAALASRSAAAAAPAPAPAPAAAPASATYPPSQQTTTGATDVESSANPATDGLQADLSVKFDEGAKAKFFLVKDKMIRVWSYITLGILLCSWTAQWVAYALPYWRGDAYHHGGFFKVCGTVDLYFDPAAKNGNGEIYPNLNSTHPERCQTLAEYCDDFSNMVKANKYWYDNAQTAFPRILGSRWFEGLGTSSSMVFGVTTLLMVLFPSTSPKVNNMNGIIALIGIFLTPWFAAIDLFISINTWDYIGVGYFSKSGTDFLYIGGQLGIATSCLDFFVQYTFLRWGTRRLRHLYPDMFIEKKNYLRNLIGANGAGQSERPQQQQYSSMGPRMGMSVRPVAKKPATSDASNNV